MTTSKPAKTLQINFRLDEEILGKLKDLSEIVGESSSDILRDLILKAHKRLTPAMLEQIETQRSIQKAVRSRILG